MWLSSKALRFVLDAVRFHAAHLDRIRDDEGADEDTRADAANDARFLREIAKTLAAEQRRRSEVPDVP